MDLCESVSLRSKSLDHLFFPCIELLLEVATSNERAVSYIVLLDGTSEGLAGPSVFERTYRCCSTKWSCSIELVKILHCGGSMDV